MKTIKEITKNVTKELVTKMVDKDERGWPPICTSFVYQPKRPRSTKADTHANGKNYPDL